MNILALAEICKCATAGCYISTLADSLTKDPDAQKDLYYTAWFAIAEQPGDYSIDSYIRTASNAMFWKYRICHMPILKEGRYPSHDAGVRRFKRKLRFFIKNN